MTTISNVYDAIDDENNNDKINDDDDKLIIMLFLTKFCYLSKLKKILKKFWSFPIMIKWA